MRFPSKVTAFNDSVVAKFPIVLEILERNDMPVFELYRIFTRITEDISEFIAILDCLYALGKLELDRETRCLHYVG